MKPIKLTVEVVGIGCNGSTAGGLWVSLDGEMPSLLECSQVQIRDSGVRIGDEVEITVDKAPGDQPK
jgi:hypothetical protein